MRAKKQKLILGMTENGMCLLGVLRKRLGPPLEKHFRSYVIYSIGGCIDFE